MRLLTLTGPSGVGKTRLGLEAAWSQVDNFDGGVWWVDLAPRGAGSRVASTLARAIGLERLPDDELVRFERLAASLDRGPLLVLLDNGEHRIDALEPRPAPVG